MFSVKINLLPTAVGKRRSKRLINRKKAPIIAALDHNIEIMEQNPYSEALPKIYPTAATNPDVALWLLNKNRNSLKRKNRFVQSETWRAAKTKLQTVQGMVVYDMNGEFTPKQLIELETQVHEYGLMVSQMEVLEENQKFIAQLELAQETQTVEQIQHMATVVLIPTVEIKNIFLRDKKRGGIFQAKSVTFASKNI